MKANCLIITQGENSSHAIAGREMLSHSNKMSGDIVTNMDVITGMVKLSDYDIIFNYTWEDSSTIELLIPYAERTILMMGDGFPIDGDRLQRLNLIPEPFNAWGYVSINLYLNITPILPNKTHYYLPHGVDIDKFRPNRIKQKKYVIGWVGDETIASKNLPLAKAVKKGVKGSELRIARGIPHEDMVDFYNSLDVLIITSDIEARPMVAYEAMACGVPVITKPVGDLAWTIMGFVNGVLVPLDADDLNYITAIDYLRTHKNLTEYIGKAGRLTAMNHCSWDVLIDYFDRIAPEPRAEPEGNWCKGSNWVSNVKPGDDPEPTNVVLLRGADLTVSYFEPSRIPTKVRGISWGGNFFLSLVADDLARRMDYQTLDNKLLELPKDTEVLYVVSPRITKSRLFKQALDMGCKVVWHWIGSDVMSLTAEYEAHENNLPPAFTYKPENQLHLGVSLNLVEELQALGLPAREMNLISNWTFGVRPLPEEFTILVYYPPPEQDVYNQEAVKRIINRLPDVKFILYGLRKGQVLDFENPGNVETVGWLDTEEEMANLYARGSCLLRYNKHDGYPSSTIEAVMMGRQVITNGKFPYTIHVESEDDVVEAIRSIRGYKVLNLRGSRYYNTHQTKDVYLDEFTKVIRGL